LEQVFYFYIQKIVFMIERIVVDNFKSIQHADVKLQKINLLIGPNNSGKSNFLQVFETIADYTNEAGDVAEFKFSSKEHKKSNVKFFVEKGEIFLNSNYERLTGSFLSTTLPSPFDAYSFFRILKKSLIYKVQVDSIKQPVTFNKDADYINKNARDIASFLQVVLNKYRLIFNRITRDLMELTGNFKEIELDYVDNTRIKLGLKDTSNNTFWNEELSEGVLYFLAILCIIHQPNPPKLLLIEEPETGIHPRRIKEVIDLIRALAKEKDIQVIMTTHSPLIVDLFEDEPECIHVFEMKGGFTQIKNLKTDIIDPINKELVEAGLEPNKDYETTLGQQWVYGFLGGVPI